MDQESRQVMKGNNLKNGELHTKVSSYIVNWGLPQEGVIKFNTDGASKQNPSIGSYGFYLRNHKGDLVYAQA